MEHDFLIGEWRIVPMRNRIERNGKGITLKPRSIAVLVRLANAKGNVVTKQELMQAVWGDAVVTEDVLTQCVVELRKAFGDHAREPAVIETIRKVGFRLIPTVLPAADELGTSATGTEPTLIHQALRRRAGLLWLAALLIVVIAASYWLLSSDELEPPGIVPERSLAVLPFVNLSSDPENEYFSYGLTEELLDSLAKISGLKVPARTSSFAFAEQNLDVRAIGRRLGVARVVEGSVRKSGQRIRITAQLVDVASGYHLWSQTYERKFEDIFAIQQEISSSIVDALRLNLVTDGGHAFSYPGTVDIDAYDLYLLGRYHFKQERIARARQLFEQAIGADPEFARAYVGLADTYLLFRDIPGSFWQMDTPSYSKAITNARAAIDKALALDPQLTDAYLARAALMVIKQDIVAVEDALLKAIDLGPNSARAHAMLGANLVGQLRIGEALESYKRAVALDPFNLRVNAEISRLIAQTGRYEEANGYPLRLLESGLQSPASTRH